MRPPWFVAHRRLPESLAGMERRLRVRRRPAAIRAARIVASSSSEHDHARHCHRRRTRLLRGRRGPARKRPRGALVAARRRGQRRAGQGRRARDYRASRIAIGDGPGQLRLARELSDAVQDAELIVIPLPATTHDELAPGSRRCWRTGRWCSCRPAPSAASCSRAPSARPATARRSPMPRPAPALPGAQARPARGHQRLRHAPAHRRLPLRLADAALRRLAQAYPSVEPAGDGLSGALMNAGPIIHPPLILMNAGPFAAFRALGHPQRRHPAGHPRRDRCAGRRARGAARGAGLWRAAFPAGRPLRPGRR